MAVVIDVRADFSAVIADLNRLEGTLSRSILASTLNRVAAGVRTEAANDIFKNYNLKRAKILERIRIRNAFANSKLSTEVYVQSNNRRRATNVISFGATQLKRGGVSVKIRRDAAKLRIKPWFILTSKRTGGTFVARRKGEGRGELGSVVTIDIPQMFTTRELTRKMLARINRTFPAEIERRVRLATRQKT